MELSVTKRFTFEACHFLPDYEGKCSKLHGHSYKLYVTLSGEVVDEGNNKGMVMDFAEIKKLVKEDIIGKLDHSTLNDFYDTPTAEVMVSDIFHTLKCKLKDRTAKEGIRVSSVKLWETEDSYAEAKE